MSITVHHLENSRSQRILWMLEELGLPYGITRYERDKRTMLAPPALRAIHPLGKAPVLEHDGRILVETAAIVEYLVEVAQGRLGPPQDEDGRLLYRQLLHYAEGSMMPPLLAILVASKLGPLGWPARRPLRSMLAVHLNWLDAELAKRTHFVGDTFSAVDIMMSFPLEAARNRAGLDSRYPHLIEWLDRMHARPAYRKALDAGGPYAYA